MLLCQGYNAFSNMFPFHQNHAYRFSHCSNILEIVKKRIYPSSYITEKYVLVIITEVRMKKIVIDLINHFLYHKFLF